MSNTSNTEPITVYPDAEGDQKRAKLRTKLLAKLRTFAPDTPADQLNCTVGELIELLNENEL